jgi:hypothetical protein
VAIGQQIPARLDHLDQACGGMVRQPLAGVPLGRSGTRGQLRGRQRAVRERPVVAEALAEVHRVQLQRTHGMLEDPGGQAGSMPSTLPDRVRTALSPRPSGR